MRTLSWCRKRTEATWRARLIRLLALCISVTLTSLTCFQVALPLAEAAGSRRICFYHPDHLGSTTLVTDDQGQVVSHSEYAPYGATVRQTGTVQPAYQFTGQRQDTTTGLYYYNARYYDPQLGRFLQPDKSVQDPSDPQTFNRYSYVRNNPVNFVDPSGNFFEIIIAAIFAIAAVSAVTSIAAGAASLIASATGFDHLGRELAKISQVAAYVATPLYFSGEGSGLALTAQLVAGAAIAAATPDEPAAVAFSGPSFNSGSPPSPLQRKAGALINYTLTTAAIFGAFATAGAIAEEAGPYISKAFELTLRKFAARLGSEFGESASELAESFQGNNKYPGVDRFRDITLKRGKIVFGGEPGSSGFFTTESAVDRTGSDATQLFQGLQVAPYNGTYRLGLTAYEVVEDTAAAFGRALANPQYGPGRLPQLFIPNYLKVLRPLYTILLRNRRLP